MGKPKEGASHQNGQAHDNDIVSANGHDKGDDRRPFSIKCEWDIKQTQQFSDDGTNTYFWRAHTVTVLLIMLCVLVYVGAFEKTKENSEYNTKSFLAYHSLPKCCL